MNTWMSSSGHRHNILNCAFEETGVGYVYAADDPGVYRYGHYWTQVFAIP
ncbi:MAG: CAP domain-containing protein [Chloroflexota bacterium]